MMMLKKGDDRMYAIRALTLKGEPCPNARRA